MSELGNRLRAARGDVSSKVVSEELGIARSTLQMYEAGLRVPKDENKVKLARYYGMSIEELFYST